MEDKIDICRPEYWNDSNGKEVSKYTVITVEDIISGKYKPRNMVMLELDEYKEIFKKL